MTNEAADILRKAKELIETRGWTRGALARDRLGQKIIYEDGYDKAACFCLVGAIECANYMHGGTARLSSLLGFLPKEGKQGLGIWNDAPGRTKEDVISAFDRAIALAEAGNA